MERTIAVDDPELVVEQGDRLCCDRDIVVFVSREID